MRIAVLSDIHGNFEALLEVEKDMDRCGVHKTFCLGDNIGYGPGPNEVVQWLRERSVPCVLGNHELGIVKPRFLSWFNPVARRSLTMTRDLLTEATLSYIRRLEPSIREEDALFVHGCPPDSQTTYLFELSDARLTRIFLSADWRACFVGHTHDLELISFQSGKLEHLPLKKGLIQMDEGSRHIVNVGSVGQPRDGENSAKYVIWDAARRTIEVRFVPYDTAKTAEKILDLGFPEINATRLRGARA